jgi:hypothetical protein
MNDLSKWFGESYKIASSPVEEDENAATARAPQSGDDEQ